MLHFLVLRWCRRMLRLTVKLRYQMDVSAARIARTWMIANAA
jgi:hypothetical protein